MHSIELLAPAKDLEAAIAAVDHGADAVYMGGSRFGARRAAANSIEDIARAAEYAHRYGVRLHAALNTLLYDDELREAEAEARRLIAADIDALIIQDMALRQMNLPVELHASTQVSNTTPEGVKFLEQCGFARVILERSLDIDQIRSIRQATSVELECFVHGAICVGHSGRCFLSRTTSTRSGNRGECSQPCRLPYDLTDSSGRTIMAGKHLLSVRDMDLSEDLEELIDAGVTSFKIEGRLKDLHYIKNVVAYYRNRLDDIIARRDDLMRSSCGQTRTEFIPDPAKSFTRGASEYMLHGKCGNVATFDTPKAVGEQIGRISQVMRDGFRIEPATDTPLHPATPLAAGDGICIVSNRGIFGTNINGVEQGIIRPDKTEGITVGAEVFRNFDRIFHAAVDRSRTTRTIDTEAHLNITREKIVLTLRDCEANSVQEARDVSLDSSTDPAKMLQTAQRQTAKSGGTIFSISNVTVEGSEWFVPLSLLGEMRREALEKLLAARCALRPSRRITADDGTARYPSTTVTRYENVTNAAAEEFYRRHGVENIEPPTELNPTAGDRVMVSSYCLRREIGECLKHNPTLRGDLFLQHGAARYRLQFDCQRCEMSLINCCRPTVAKQ